MTGISALRSACLKIMGAVFRPLARAVLIYSWLMASSMDDRVSRAM